MPVITIQLLYTEIECSSTPCPAASHWVVATLHNSIMMSLCTLYTLTNLSTHAIATLGCVRVHVIMKNSLALSRNNENLVVAVHPSTATHFDGAL